MPDASNMIPVYDEYSALVYASNSKNIRFSMVNGKWIMQQPGEITNINKTDTMEAMKQIVIIKLTTGNESVFIFKFQFQFINYIR